MTRPDSSSAVMYTEMGPELLKVFFRSTLRPGVACGGDAGGELLGNVPFSILPGVPGEAVVVDAAIVDADEAEVEMMFDVDDPGAVEVAATDADVVIATVDVDSDAMEVAADEVVFRNAVKLVAMVMVAELDDVLESTLWEALPAREFVVVIVELSEIPAADVLRVDDEPSIIDASVVVRDCWVVATYELVAPKLRLAVSPLATVSV